MPRGTKTMEEVAAKRTQTAASMAPCSEYGVVEDSIVMVNDAALALGENFVLNHLAVVSGNGAPAAEKSI